MAKPEVPIPEKKEPEPVQELLRAYLSKSRELTEEEMNEVIEYAAGTEDLLGLVTSMGFSKRDYYRLHKAILRAGEAVRKPITPEKEIDRLEAKDYKDFMKQVWDEVMAVGKGATAKWYRIAGELGFYDKETKKVNMAAFIAEAVTFYVENKAKVEELEMEAAANIGIARMMMGVSTRLYTRQVMLRTMIESLMRDRPDLRMRLMPLLAATTFKGER
jgi:hypothetical protein